MHRVAQYVPRKLFRYEDSPSHTVDPPSDVQVYYGGQPYDEETFSSPEGLDLMWEESGSHTLAVAESMPRDMRRRAVSSSSASTPSAIVAVRRAPRTQRHQTDYAYADMLVCLKFVDVGAKKPEQ